MKPTLLISTAIAILVLSGCAQQQQLSESNTATGVTARFASIFKPVSKAVSSKNRQPEQYPPKKRSSLDTEIDDIWPIIENELAFSNNIPDRKVSSQLAWLDSNQKYFDNTLKRANIYLPYVLDRVLDAGLPSEVALLPFIESAYNPFAESPSGAAGLWQFIPATGNLYGLDQSQWYEGRKDIVQSTDAAIRYIQLLNESFEGDWLLTFAAYNGGPGTVKRAIEANERKGLKTDFWSLDLPQETRRYVPRLVALSKVITQPDKYEIDRMSIPVKPSFDIVKLDKPIDLAKAAKIADMGGDDIYKLNPGYTRWATPPSGPYHLVLPADLSSDFLDRLASLPEKHWQPGSQYRVKAGDTLSKIARAQGVSTKELAIINNLNSNSILKIGQVLKTPAAVNLTAAKPSFTTTTPLTRYRVQPGDSLWSIAKTHNIQPKDLLVWNNLNANAVIKPGQTLQFYKGAQPSTNQANNYQVKQGDSLYNIAKRFRVAVNDLMAWNDLATNSLIKPGQQLKIYASN
ncbi:MAG: LysM peptidoglycan-binding domain-containing protein [Porticoccaceae bacterium]|nr:LysM peptidoglycan-binding domain-containing protein [Porticoccaceae bacterium]